LRAAQLIRERERSLRYDRAMRVGLVLLVIASCHRDSAPPAPVRPQTFNDRVLSLITEYPAHGFGGYAWPAPAGTAGTTRDLRVGDTVIARAGAGNHCVGMTLEVFWRALEQCDGGMPLDETSAKDLKRRWYVPELGGRGSVDALTAHRLGAEVSLADAQPGDFVQAWNADGTFGHSFVFLAADAEQIRYWSSQPWTDGIDRSESPFGDGGFEPSRIYLARASCR
jgi:hypothetical protein